LIIRLRVKRFDPERDPAPHWETYDDLDLDPDRRVLDALHEVKWHRDGTLSFRRSCAHGVCGSDAMVINGRNRLACVAPVGDLGPEITVEPMRGLPVIKDLVVDTGPFFAQYRSVQPWLQAAEPDAEPGAEAGGGGRERLQSPQERARYDDTTKCILCAACTTSCPIYWGNPTFVGPAALVNAHRFVFDSRDEARSRRLDLLDRAPGVWRCRTAFNCTDACPRGIKVTQAIEELKRTIARGS
jgi:succinate dehydrogenase / fumarate reductase iron-sulfur subunit